MSGELLQGERSRLRAVPVQLRVAVARQHLVQGALSCLGICKDRVAAGLDHTGDNDGDPYGFVRQIERHDVRAVAVHLCKRGRRREQTGACFCAALLAFGDEKPHGRTSGITVNKVRGLHFACQAQRFFLQILTEDRLPANAKDELIRCAGDGDEPITQPPRGLLTSCHVRILLQEWP
ncbi:hypothetical protein [Achromobacter marplatensis]|uniref:hypothetical protein n=1 Tax=Achromobacter marplatensis TaxID=470868 RepID=UPI003C792579